MADQDFNLNHQIQDLFGVTTEELSLIQGYFEPKLLQKGTFLQKKDAYQSNLSYVQEGYLRMFATDPQTGKEVTQWIVTPGTFSADLSSLFFNEPARWQIQAITECQLLYLSKEAYKKMAKEVPRWIEIERLFMGKCFSTLENRMHSHLALTAEERYHYFFNLNPKLFNQVPLQYIASMLGMTPETFSRIRKKLSS